MTLLARWRELDSTDRRALVSAGWRMFVVCGSIGLLGVVRTQRLLAGKSRSNSLRLASAEIWHRRALAVRRVSHRIPGARCLARSMVLWWWMREEDLDPRLCMGIRPGVEMIEGHAWIECDGHTIDETAEAAASYQGLNWRSPE